MEKFRRSHQKGAKSEIVVFWKIIDVEEKNDKGEIEKKKLPLLRYYNVFHISQIEGVEPLKEKLNTEIEPIEEADRIIKNYVDREQLVFNECKSNKAYYAPLIDTVVVPLKEQYSNISEYYSTTFHELVHSSGSKNRLNRLETSNLASFGSETYSKEELVAEIGSASILNYLGIETKGTFQNSASYIESWLQVLRNDNKFIVSASSKAEKAVNYILGIE
ncbi:MAG: ArdC family protein [Ruminococcus sp.]